MSVRIYIYIYTCIHISVYMYRALLPIGSSLSTSGSGLFEVSACRDIILLLSDAR